MINSSAIYTSFVMPESVQYELSLITSEVGR